MTAANNDTRPQLSPDEFLQLVKNGPLVSIDLIVENGKGEILVGRRTGRPAAGSWFVPGSRLRKNETLDIAFEETSLSELGIRIPRARAEFVGVFEHFYGDNFRGESGIPTQYVVLAYRIKTSDIQLSSLPLSHHDQWRWMSVREGAEGQLVHSNARPYFLAATRTPTVELVALYSIYQTAISYYTNIIWIFPAAVLALNVTAWGYFKTGGDRWLLLLVAVADLLFTQAFAKLVANQRAIIKVLFVVEDALRIRVGNNLVPDFHSEHNWLTKIKSADYFRYGIAAITLIAFAICIWRFASP